MISERESQLPQLSPAYRAGKLAYPRRILRRRAFRSRGMRAPRLSQDLLRDRRDLESSAPVQSGLERRRSGGIDSRIRRPAGQSIAAVTLATFVQDQGDICVTIRPVLSARTRAKKYRSIQPNISRNPRKEDAYSALCIGIQEFHTRYFGRNAESRQFSLN